MVMGSNKATVIVIPLRGGLLHHYTSPNCNVTVMALQALQ